MGWAITTESQLQHHDIPETPPNIQVILQRDQLFAITFSAHPYSRPLLLEAQREHRVGTLAMDHNTALTTARVASALAIISTRLCAHKQRPPSCLSRLDGGCVFQMSGLRHVAARRARTDLDECAPIPGLARGSRVSSSSADRPWAARCTVTTLVGLVTLLRPWTATRKEMELVLVQRGLQWHLQRRRTPHDPPTWPPDHTLGSSCGTCARAPPRPPQQRWA